MLYPFCTCNIIDFHVGHHFDHSWPHQLSLTKSTTWFRMCFVWWIFVLYKCPLYIFLLQMMLYYGVLCYYYDYHHLQTHLLLSFLHGWAFDVYFLWTYSVSVLILGGFGYSKSIDALSFHFQALTDEVWVILQCCCSLDSKN